VSITEMTMIDFLIELGRRGIAVRLGEDGATLDIEARSGVLDEYFDEQVDLLTPRQTVREKLLQLKPLIVGYLKRGEEVRRRFTDGLQAAEKSGVNIHAESPAVRRTCDALDRAMADYQNGVVEIESVLAAFRAYIKALGEAEGIA